MKASKHACISLAVSNCHSFYSCSYTSTLNVTIGVTLAKTIIKVMNFELIKPQQMTKQQITVVISKARFESLKLEKVF